MSPINEQQNHSNTNFKVTFWKISVLHWSTPFNFFMLIICDADGTNTVGRFMFSIFI